MFMYIWKLAEISLAARSLPPFISHPGEARSRL